jgi:hypothetical protein
MSFILKKCLLFTVLVSYGITEGVSRIVLVYLMIFHTLQRKICKQASVSFAILAKIASTIFIKFYIWDSFNQIRGKCQILIKPNHDVILH